MNPMAGPTGKTGNKVPQGYKMGQIQKFTPEMMELFQSLFAHTGPDSFLSQLAQGDESAFNEMEAPALRQFGELQGGIASRFSGQGMGARRSSGFQNTMNQAGSDFAQSLQSQRTQTRMNALKELMGFSNQLLNQNPYESFLTKKAPSFFEQLMSSLGENFGAVPQAIGQSFMGGF